MNSTWSTATERRCKRLPKQTNNMIVERRMKRKEFICKTSCGIAGLVGAFAIPGGELDAQSSRRYSITVDIYEAREDSWCHKKDDRCYSL